MGSIRLSPARWVAVPGGSLLALLRVVLCLLKWYPFPLARFWISDISPNSYRISGTRIRDMARATIVCLVLVLVLLSTQKMHIQGLSQTCPYNHVQLLHLVAARQLNSRLVP